MSERSFDDFDDFAKDYRSIHSENVKISGADSLYFAEMKVRLLLEHETNVSLKILDVGCGDGVTELFMEKYFRNWKITGIDVSAKSIAAAKEKNLSSSTFSIYNGSHIPFDDNSFDLVFVAGVFHHIDFSLHPQLVQEIQRVLKNKGRLYFFEHNPLNPLTRYLVKTCVFDKTAVLLTNSYASRLLSTNGFQVNFKKFIIFFPRKGVLSKLIFLEKYLQWIRLGGQYFLQAQKH